MIEIEVKSLVADFDRVKQTLDGGAPDEGMGVQTDYAGYLNQMPLLTDSSHGLCAILLAASELEAHAP